MTLPVATSFDGTDTLTLKGGIMIYADSEKSRLATIHAVLPVTDPRARPELGPGALVRRDSILKLLKGLEGVAEQRFLLPENVLCWDAGVLVWWRPAGRRRIFFTAQNDALNSISGKEVMHPPLVFRAHAGGLSIWALEENKRPMIDTPLCRAPYFNVYGAGNMCLGNIQLPDQPRPDNIPAWEECFFGSNFAHGNSQELVDHPGGHTGYWVALAKQNATKSTATRFLLLTRTTLKDVIRMIGYEEH